MKLQTLLFVSSILLAPAITQANTLTINDYHNIAKHLNVPKRGSSMRSVRKHYGKAKRVTHSRGRVTKRWPRITRWEYGKFTVYFEKNTVIHTVIYYPNP